MNAAPDTLTGRTEKRPDPTTPEASGRKPNTHHESKKEIRTMKRIITAAALAAALLEGAPRAAAVCPYTVGPLGRYIAPATVQGMTATDDGNAVEVWCTDALDGDDWFFTVDNKTELKIYSRVNLVIDANGTPDDYSDDKVIDALFCNDCTED